MSYEQTLKWIPLTVQKPSEGQAVHISARHGYVVEDTLYTKKYGFNMREGFISRDGKFIDIREANAWMPKVKLTPYVEERD